MIMSPFRRIVDLFKIPLIAWLLWLLAPVVWPMSIEKNVRDYGARGDGETLDTAAIQAAIDDCAESGGTVLLPPGRYLSGTIFLKSRLTLHIMAGALLLGSTNISDYPPITPQMNFYGKEFCQHSLIYGENLHDIAIIGRGIIDGQGGAFAVTTKKRPDRYMNRPYVLWLVQCSNVLIEGVSMRNSARWMQHYLRCEDLTIRGLYVDNHCNQNNDMIDIDGCRNVVVSDCMGDSDDDAITLKSTFDRPCENIVISNCVISSHCNAIKMGTESHGGFKNITISNCVIKPSRRRQTIFGHESGLGGIVLTIVDGGILDGVLIDNVRIDGPRVPLFIRLGDRGRVFAADLPRPEIGTLRNVHISNLIATAADTCGCSITGLPGHPLENISLSSVRITFAGGGVAADAEITVPEKPDSYPESTLFGKLPAFGMYLRHINNVSLNDVVLTTLIPDHRPALVADDVHGLHLSGFRAQGSLLQTAWLALHNTREAFITGAVPLHPIRRFLSVTGDESTGIVLASNDHSRAKKYYTTKAGAKKSSVKVY